MELDDIGRDGPIAHRSRLRKRPLLIATACTLTVVVGGGVTAAFAIGGSDDKPQQSKHVAAATAPITKGTLQGVSSATGTLAFGGARSIPSGIGGTVTALPAPGATVKLGGSLFAIDNQPTYLMYGGLPAWRSFESGMRDGPDIKALEQSLTTLGFFDRTPDEVFTWQTVSAIQRWQKATGQEVTGSIPLGRIVFAAGEVRVAELNASVGQQTAPGGPLITVTDLAKIVSVNLKLADQQLATVGAKVSIDLPNGKSTSGTVTSVGVPTEQDGSNGGKEVIIPVVISLDDPAAAGDLQQATVTVRFPTDKRDNVLSVPVGALLALDGNRFGVEVVRPDGTTTRVPVTTGLFAGGRVEISGDGLKANQKVVVPTS
ncbi:peptidoglycan-binding protein [Diaminobutyricibacter sp. McL0618]|uniref:peptidoglycan-binding protein n=1 Tax=Leifsonia sp. McL0618 TaxID=3415677 RepID=UPI003CF7F8EA